MERLLIVNADDLGLSEGVNDGIVRAHREGIVTSASLMVHGPAAAHAVHMAGDLDLGLHIDLSEWAFRDGQWVNVYQRVPPNDGEAIEREIDEQLRCFERFTGRLPSHLDSHQHVHGDEPIRSIARRVAEQLGVPLRSFSRQVRYCGSFYGQAGRGTACADAISAGSLVTLLASLPAGVTELGCHPGNDPDLNSVYRAERLMEMATLCDPRVRRTVEVETIRLVNFLDIRSEGNRSEQQDQARGLAVAGLGRKT